MADGVAKSTAPGNALIIEPAERVIEMSEIREPVADEGAVEETVETPTTDDQPRDKEGKFASPKVQGRIDELTREKHDARRERDIERMEKETLRLENERLRLEKAGGAAPQETPAPVADPADPKPDINVFEGTHEEYVEELSRWSVRDESRRLDADKSEVQAITSLGNQRDGFIERGEAYAKEHGINDFREMTVENSDLRITETMRDVLWTSEDGPAVTMYLANNPSVAESISKLPASQQAFELGRIKVEGGGPKKITDAPPPVEVPTGSGGEGSQESWERKPADDPKEWQRKRNEQLYGKR